MAKLKVKQISDYVSATNSLIASAQVNVDASIDSLESEVSSNLALLSAELSGDVSALESYDAVLSGAISSEKAARASVDSVISEALSAEISETNSEIASADVRFSTIEGNVASAADNADLTSLETRVSGDESNLALVSTDVSAILAGAGTTLDSFNELVSYINSLESADSLEAVGELASIDSRFSAGESTDVVLSNALSAEISTTDAEVSSIDVVLAGLATGTAFGSLETRVSEDESDLASAILSIDTRVSAEESASDSQDAVLSLALSAEISTTDLEVSSLKSTDDALLERISAEEVQHSTDFAALSAEVSGDVASIDTRLSTADSGIASIDTALEGFAKEAYIHGIFSDVVPAGGGGGGIFDTAGNANGVGSHNDQGTALVLDLNVAAEGIDNAEREANMPMFTVNGLSLSHNAIAFTNARTVEITYAKIGYDLEPTDVIEFRYIRD